MIRCPVCGGVCGPHICNRNVERDPPTDVRTGIVTWMRAVADVYAANGNLVGDGYARNWRTTSVDAEGAYVAWREEESLTDAALAGLRRLLRVTP